MPVVPHDVLRKFVYDIYRGAGGHRRRRAYRQRSRRRF